MEREIKKVQIMALTKQWKYIRGSWSNFAHKIRGWRPNMRAQEAPKYTDCKMSVFNIKNLISMQTKIIRNSFA